MTFLIKYIDLHKIKKDDNSLKNNKKQNEFYSR